MIEIADVFRRFAADYVSAHGASMLPSHRRAIEDILDCRTAALGGQVGLMVGGVVGEGHDHDVLVGSDPPAAVRVGACIRFSAGPHPPSANRIRSGRIVSITCAPAAGRDGATARSIVPPHDATTISSSWKP